MWEDGIDIRDVKEIRTRTTVYFGVGAIQSIQSIVSDLSRRGITSVLAVTGKGSYRSSGAWAPVEAALTGAGFRFAIYDGVRPNPTVDQVEEAVALGRSIEAGAVIGIGGGSALDAGKSVAALLKNPGHSARELYSGGFQPAEALPFIAINLTHGTGSETNRFAVVTIPELNHKPVVAFDCLYPLWAIDDPALMSGLSPRQTRLVSIDAVNHVVEAATSCLANPYAVMMGRETIALVAKYLPAAIDDPGDLKARYFLAYAAMIAGVAFDNSLLHYTHALEHPLSAVKPDLSHGLGLAMLLPAVIADIYPVRAAVLAELLAPLVPGLKGGPEEAAAAARGVEKWLGDCGVTEKLRDEGFSEKDVESLVNLAFETPSLSLLLDQAPTPPTRERVKTIYLTSLQKLP